MFGTLHWNSQDKEVEFVKRSHGSSNLERNTACDICRTKKVISCEPRPHTLPGADIHLSEPDVQIRCRTSNDGCNRCKRLGKACTFSFMKHGHSQRTRKESTILAKHEPQLDFSIQSSACSITNETSQEGVASNKQHSLPAGGKFDSGQGQVQELLPECSMDISPSFDPAFLERLSQQFSDQDGDIISGLAITQFPFFISENLQLPPLSSGDEVELSPQELSGPEIGITVDSPFLHIPNLLLPQAPPAQSCQCLAAVVFAVEESKTSCHTGNRAELDTIIAYQKKAINC